MASINTNDLRITNAYNMMTSLEKPSYVFIGRPAQWETDKAVPMVARQDAGDNSAPYPRNNWDDFYETWDQMLSMKKIDPNKVFFMLPRIEWTSGVVYDMYRHDYTPNNKSHSNAANLYDAVFYVINSKNEVYVCLDNNRNQRSLVEPMNGADVPFYTSDGYQWLKIYKVSPYLNYNYTTNNLIPVSYNLTPNRKRGEVHTVVIDSPGRDYTTSPIDFVNQVPAYYCNVIGDGTGAVAKVVITNGEIVEVRIQRPGQNYTYAELEFVPNKVYASMVDLDTEMNPINPMGDGTFKSTVIISPPDGWGAEDPDAYADLKLARQLGATRICIFSDLKYKEVDFVDDGFFRQIGVLQLPSGVMEDNHPRATITACGAIALYEPLPGEGTEFIYGEEISQGDARAMVVGFEQVGEVYVLRYIQDPKLHTVNGKMKKINSSGLITGDTSLTQATPRSSYAGELYGMEFHSGMLVPEIEKYSGMITYQTNLSPIKRNQTQTERISLLISY